MVFISTAELNVYIIKAEGYWTYGYLFQYRRTSAIWLADTNSIPASHSGLSWEKLNLQTIIFEFLEIN